MRRGKIGSGSNVCNACDWGGGCDFRALGSRHVAWNVPCLGLGILFEGYLNV